MQGWGGWAGGRCAARNGLVAGISGIREHFPLETGAASAQRCVGRRPRSCPVSIRSFSTASSVSPRQEDVPVPDGPYLGTACSCRQAGSVSSWQGRTRGNVPWAALATLHDTGAEPSLQSSLSIRGHGPSAPSQVLRVPFPPRAHSTPLP